jgi:hypothetical protein
MRKMGVELIVSSILTRSSKNYDSRLKNNNEQRHNDFVFTAL